MTVTVPRPQHPLILLTGATGYIGGRLLHALEARGERVRCLSRHPEYLSARVGPGTEVVHGDVLSPETLRAALKDVETAYYLVHSMASSGSFAKTDREAAAAFGSAARAASVRRIIYLGGLGEGDLSDHLASRQEVGGILRGSSVPTIEFPLIDRDRLGECVVRDAASTRRAAALDGHAALGEDAHTAHGRRLRGLWRYRRGRCR